MGGSYDCTSGSVPHTQENASFVLRFSACPSWERTFSLYCVFPIVLSSSPEEKEKLGVGTKMPPEEKYIALSPSPSPTFRPSFVPQQWTLSLTTHLAPSPLSICSVHLICCIRNQVREGGGAACRRILLLLSSLSLFWAEMEREQASKLCSRWQAFITARHIMIEFSQPSVVTRQSLERIEGGGIDEERGKRPA